jgi:hypothetical protein
MVRGWWPGPPCHRVWGRMVPVKISDTVEAKKMATPPGAGDGGALLPGTCSPQVAAHKTRVRRLGYDITG